MKSEQEQEQCTLQVNGRLKQEKYLPRILRVLFAVKTIKNKFSFVLCLFDPSEPDVLDHMWVHEQEIRQEVCLPLIGCRQEVYREEVHQDTCMPLIGPDRKYNVLWVRFYSF